MWQFSFDHNNPLQSAQQSRSGDGWASSAPHPSRSFVVRPLTVSSSGVQRRPSSASRRLRQSVSQAQAPTSPTVAARGPPSRPLSAASFRDDRGDSTGGGFNARGDVFMMAQLAAAGAPEPAPVRHHPATPPAHTLAEVPHAAAAQRDPIRRPHSAMARTGAPRGSKIGAAAAGGRADRADDFSQRPLVIPTTPATKPPMPASAAMQGGLRALLIAGVNAPFNDSFAPVALLSAHQALEEDHAATEAARVVAAANAKKQRPTSAHAARRSYAEVKERFQQRAAPIRPKSAGVSRRTAASPLRMLDAAGEWASSIDEGRRQEAMRVALLADVVHTNAVHAAPRPRSAAPRRPQTQTQGRAAANDSSLASQSSLGNFFMGFTVQETHR